MKSVKRAVASSLAIFAAAFVFQLSAFARCPIADGATLVVRAPYGNLHIDTSGKDVVDVQVSNKDLTVEEVCGKDQVKYSAGAPGQMRGNVDWKISVPRSVNLDLVTFGGSITMGDSDGSATLRTTGGAVIVGRIKGKTAIVTQGGFIKAGDIGDSVELRSSNSGSLEVGNIAGNADLHTAGGSITVGTVNGKVTANTGGGLIFIKGARGDVVVTTEAGDIHIGDAFRISAKTAGGSITIPKVRGPLQGHTESGDIRIDSAGSWVEASTGQGSIYLRLNPVNLDGDLHIDLETAVGDITIFMPERMKANVEAVIDRPTLTGRRITSEFPMNALAPGIVPGRIAAIPTTPRFMAPDRQVFPVNGGGNPVKLHTSLGKIEIKIRM